MPAPIVFVVSDLAAALLVVASALILLATAVVAVAAWPARSRGRRRPRSVPRAGYPPVPDITSILCGTPGGPPT